MFLIDCNFQVKIRLCAPPDAVNVIRNGATLKIPEKFKIAKNPERYNNLGKLFLEKYEQAFRDLCREK